MGWSIYTETDSLFLLCTDRRSTVNKGHLSLQTLSQMGNVGNIRVPRPVLSVPKQCVKTAPYIGGGGGGGGRGGGRWEGGEGRGNRVLDKNLDMDPKHSQHTIRQSPPLSGSSLVSPPSPSQPLHGANTNHPLLPRSPDNVRSFSALLHAAQNERAWNRIYFELAPGSKPNNMAAVMEVTLFVLKLTILPNVWISARKSGSRIGKNAFLFLGISFPTSAQTGKGARARFGNTRVHPTCICYKWPFADDLWLRFVLTKKPKTRGGPCDARHASSWGESLKTADVVTIFTAWILPSLGWNRKKKH